MKYSAMSVSIHQPFFFFQNYINISEPFEILFQTPRIRFRNTSLSTFQIVLLFLGWIDNEIYMYLLNAQRVKSEIQLQYLKNY